MTRSVVALLGRRDQPTDAIERYCVHLGAALRAHDFAMEHVRVPWLEHGWPAVLREFRQKAPDWKGRWVLLQYTALAWSPRAFPTEVPRMMEVLRGAGAHIGVVFHDAQPYSGTRMVDVLRRFVQRRTMRRILRSSDQGILTVPAAKLCWISSEMKNVVFIPVGANFSSVSPSASESTLRQDETPTVAVYGVTGGVAGRQEISQITTAVRFASERLGRLRLMIFGRNADSAEASLRNGLRDLPVVLAVSGVLPEIEVQRALHASDVLLFVRGPISSRRGSAIAGISCGLPIIAFSGSETAAPITDAGVVLVPGDNKIALGEALVRVLRDREYHARLAERSRTAYNYHFSWAAIAARYAEVLNAPPDAYKP